MTKSVFLRKFRAYSQSMIEENNGCVKATLWDVNDWLSINMPDKFDPEKPNKE